MGSARPRRPGLEDVSAQETLEHVVEPYLIQRALIQRTPRGRVLERFGWEHVGLKPISKENEDSDAGPLFGAD